MADKHINGSSSHKSRWTDGLPHNFEGWGPKTPDPDEVRNAAAHHEDELLWSGDVDDRHHIIWRFDGKRRHH